MEIYNYKRGIIIIIIIIYFNCILNLKWIVTLTLSNMPAGLFFALQYFSFTFPTHLA